MQEQRCCTQSVSADCVPGTTAQKYACLCVELRQIATAVLLAIPVPSLHASVCLGLVRGFTWIALDMDNSSESAVVLAPDRSFWLARRSPRSSYRPTHAVRS